MFINCFNTNLKLNNLKKKFYKIKEENIIINNTFNHCFGSLVEINNKIVLYLTNGKDNFSTMPQIIEYYESIDGIHFMKNNEIKNINLKAFCNNATIINIDNDLIGIGGRHVEKHIQEKHNHRNCECKNENYHPRLKPPFEICKGQFYNNGSGTLPFLNDTFFSKCFMNGIYCIKTNLNNLNNWNLIEDKPIISGMNEGLIDRVFGATTFDSQNSLIYDIKSNLYYFYCRSNHRIKGRFIQYSTSKDLKSWDKFRYITCSNFDFLKDNFYSPNFFYYPEENDYIGLLISHISNTNKSSLKLVHSKNLIDWEDVSTLLEFSGNDVYLFSKNIAHNGMILSYCKKEFYFYLIHNFETNGKWIRYSIRKDGFVSYISENIIGTLEINDEIKLNNKIIINYKTFLENGYLKIYIKQDNIILYEKLLKGDEIYETIIIPENIRNIICKISMELYNSEFFSLKIN